MAKVPASILSVFTCVERLEDFVPADHPLRSIRLMVIEALVLLGGLFSGV
uniref:IS4 family transposase n=1 Tax=Rhizobium meliloti TaxID=382 RepID=I2E1R5_RHIML|nr:IS4 family transposase [Sinorhizobium meliloti]